MLRSICGPAFLSRNRMPCACLCMASWITSNSGWSCGQPRRLVGDALPHLPDPHLEPQGHACPREGDGVRVGLGEYSRPLAGEYVTYCRLLASGTRHNL